MYFRNIWDSWNQRTSHFDKHGIFAGKTNLKMQSKNNSPETIHVFRESREQELRIAIILIFHLLSDNGIYLFVNPVLAPIK